MSEIQDIRFKMEFAAMRHRELAEQVKQTEQQRQAAETEYYRLRNKLNRLEKEARDAAGK